MNHDHADPAAPPPFVTLKVRPPKGQGGKWGYLSGTVVGHNARTITLHVERYDAWRCTTSYVDVALDRSRIVKVVSGHLPD